jgi:hypothetical protein
MASQPCAKCGEQVDEAKAFCPACGNAMFEERERTTKSSFDTMDSTVQLGQTMYNQMLSDMGLDISKSPNAKKSVTLQPAAPAPRPAKQQQQQPSPPQPGAADVTPKGSNRKLWVIAIVVGIALFFLALLVVAAAGVIFYMSGARN